MWLYKNHENRLNDLFFNVLSIQSTVKTVGYSIINLTNAINIKIKIFLY